MVCKYYTLHTSILATKKLKWRYFLCMQIWKR
nr:MAG TPA: hypothetical protein [Caudoviricetes sp.]